MIPGFVNIYKDDEEFVHLYFFNGIDDNDKPIYKDIDLSNIPFTYSCITPFDYKFDNKSIIRINCELVPNDINNKIEKKTLTI